MLLSSVWLPLHNRSTCRFNYTGRALRHARGFHLPAIGMLQSSAWREVYTKWNTSNRAGNCLCSFSYRRQKSHLFWCSFWGRSTLRCRQIRLVGRRSFSLSDSLNGQSRVSCDSKEKVIHHKGMSRQADVNLSLLGDHRDAVGNRLRVVGLVNGELHR